MGYLLRGPMGGMFWHHLQYVLGLIKLGHKVYYFEDSGDSEYACYHPLSGENNLDPSFGIKYLTEVFKRFQLEGIWAYYDGLTDTFYGPQGGTFRKQAGEFDLLLNLSGANVLRDFWMQIPNRAFIDTDPLFTQIRNLTEPKRKELCAKHNRFFSFAGNIQHSSCSIPDDGFSWQISNQPIVLANWKPSLPDKKSRFTTIMQWRSYKDLQYEGVPYGMKRESFQAYFQIPEKCKQKFEIAMGSPDAPRKELRQVGWKITNPLEVALYPWDYQDYLQNSLGEFSVAKDGYVKSWSGWFSERSACYLASGRPVILQDTGFSNYMQTGEGLLCFSNPEEALEALEESATNIERHADAARSIAETYFDSDNVLNSLLERCM